MTTTLTIEEKIEGLKEQFSSLQSPQEKYLLIIDLGKELPLLDPRDKMEENLVRGCQSSLYLTGNLKEGKIFFSASTDALISAGLAALLIHVYNGESIETVITSPPQFLQTFGLQASLSPNRSSGFLHIYLRMKKIAIDLIAHRSS